MYAIIKISGRQYKVAPDEQFEVDNLNVEPGGTVTVQDVIMVSDGDNLEIGTPKTPYRVELEVLEHDRRPKIKSVVFKRRGGMRRMRGHRQQYTVVKVKSIVKGTE